MNKIPFFDYPDFFKSNEKLFIETTSEVGRRGAFIMQKDLTAFEAKIAKYTGSKYAVGVANATDGLQMCFMAGGIRSGDEVIICSHTMIATASAIHFAGGIPVPIEAGVDHLMDSEKIENFITDKTKAICPTHLNGRTANMDKIKDIANKYDLQIYEDAAQALGSKWNNKCAGTFGVASCISFYPAKILGCLGDGGAILTSDDDLYQKLLLLRDHGRDKNGDVKLWGFNSRLDNLQAAYLNIQFENYDKIIERRRKIAEIYDVGLSEIKELKIPNPPSKDINHYDVFQNYELEAENRNELKSYLSDNNIGTLIQWGGKAIHQFKNLGFKQSLPFTDSLFDRLLMLPINMTIKNDEIEYICEKIKNFYKK